MNIYSVCSNNSLLLIFLFSQNFVFRMIACIRRLIYTSFILGVIILICSLTYIVFSSSAVSCEYECFKCFNVNFGAF